MSIPKRCPVIVIHAKADNDRNGDPRRCFLVIEAATGNHVETLDEGYHGEGQLHARYPWTSWHALRSYGYDEPAAYCVYPTSIEVPPSEYQRLLRRNGPDNLDERTAPLRAMADRNERRATKREHVRRVHS